MLELDKSRLFGTTGSGQQKKAWDSNILYKIDSKYRESNKEVSASSFAEACELNHVTYRRVGCLIDGQRYWCSACKSYLKSNDISIPLYNMIYGINIPTNMSAVDMYRNIREAVNERTGILYTDIDKYFIKLLTFDFLIANDDRHLRNIEIIKHLENTYEFAPIFDNGHSFFRTDSILTYEQLEMNDRRFKSKPFSTNKWKNILSIEKSKTLAKKWYEMCTEKFGGISRVPGISDAHAKVIRYRYKLLINKK